MKGFWGNPGRLEGGGVLGCKAACEGSSPGAPGFGLGSIVPADPDPDPNSPGALPPGPAPLRGSGGFAVGSYRGPGRSHRPAVRFCPGLSEEASRGLRSGVRVAGSGERAGWRGGGGRRA